MQVLEYTWCSKLSEAKFLFWYSMSITETKTFYKYRSFETSLTSYGKDIRYQVVTALPANISFQDMNFNTLWSSFWFQFILMNQLSLCINSPHVSIFVWYIPLFFFLLNLFSFPWNHRLNFIIFKKDSFPLMTCHQNLYYSFCISYFYYNYLMKLYILIKFPKPWNTLYYMEDRCSSWLNCCINDTKGDSFLPSNFSILFFLFSVLPEKAHTIK